MSYINRFFEIWNELNERKGKGQMITSDMINIVKICLEEENKDRRTEAIGQKRSYPSKDAKVTDKQKAMLKKFGVTVTDDTTIKQASEMIDKLIKEKKKP